MCASVCRFVHVIIIPSEAREKHWIPQSRSYRFVQVSIMPSVLWVFFFVKRCHNLGNPYKGKHLVGASLPFQRFCP